MDHRFYSFFNRSAFLHAEYCVPSDQESDFHMIKLWAGNTKDGEVEKSACHYLSFADLRHLCYLILTGDIQDGEAYNSFRGKVVKEKVISRWLKIRHEDDKYFFTVAEGPGVEGNNGIIEPDKAAAAQTWNYTTLVYNEKDHRQSIIKFALEMQAWLTGVTNAMVLAIPR
jgi:hypothetical protein